MVEGTDRFIQPIVASLEKRDDVSHFAPSFIRIPLVGTRVNELLLKAQLRAFLRQHDLVFFEWAGPLAAQASHIRSGAVKIVRAHRTEIFSMLDKFNWLGIDRVVFVSEAMRSRFAGAFPEHKDKAIVVNTGADMRRFAPRPHEFSWRIGMLGNLTPRKRVYEVICALSELPADIPWNLAVAGAPIEGSLDYWDALQGIVLELGIEKHVEFAGEIIETPTWLQQRDIFISASFSEGQQLSLIEAMASGCYCLSHCWDGSEEILPRENIFTTDSDLRKKLIDYASWSSGRKEEAQVGMRRIAESRFDESMVVRSIGNMVEELAHAGRIQA